MLDRVQFAKAYAKMIEEKLGLKAVIDISDYSISIEDGEFKGKMSTANAYGNYVKSIRNGEDEEETLKGVLEFYIKIIVDTHNSKKEIQELEKFRDKIYPFVKSMEYFNNKGMKENLAIIKSLSADIGVSCVLDYDEMIYFITKAHLEKWEMTGEELYKLALENFKRDKDVPMTEHFAKAFDTPFYCFDSNDTYDATRVLLTHRIEEIGQKFKGKFYIGIPNRDFLIIFPSNSKAYRRMFMMMVHKHYYESTYGVSEHCYSYIRGELVKELG